MLTMLTIFCVLFTPFELAFMIAFVVNHNMGRCMFCLRPHDDAESARGER